MPPPYGPAPQTRTVGRGGLGGVRVAALRAEDPLACPVPYVMPGGTDARSFRRIGITGFGFAPLLLGPGLDHLGPLDGLAFGIRVLDRFLDTR